MAVDRFDLLDDPRAGVFSRAHLVFKML